MPPRTNINEASPIMQLKDPAAMLLLLIKKHTSLDEGRLKDVSQTMLDDPSVFDACFRLLIKNGWIERGGAGWRTTLKGERWLEAETGSISIEDEEVGDNEQLKKPYDVAKLKVEQKTLSIFQALRKIEKKEIIMSPDFQRAFVWDVVRQSRLIESILIRIPLPAFYLDATDLVRWTVVDGLQRLTTLQRYCRDHEFGLTGLEFLTELDGLRFPQLPQKFQVVIEDDTQLIFNNLLPGTPIEAKFTIFSRVNTGGMQLNAQEIRHALNQGPITNLLRRLASSNEFLRDTDWGVPSRRMADQEVILRSLSFLYFGWQNYREFAEFDGFLIRTMGRFNTELDDEKLSELGSEFLTCVSKVKNIFGIYAFRKFYERGGRRGPINKALFEVWTTSVRDYDDTMLTNKRDRIVEQFIRLMNRDF